MRRRLPGLILPALVAVAAGITALSCTPEERHRALTFFFDGVPPLHPVGPVPTTAARPTMASPGAVVERPGAVVWYEHPPSGDAKKCGACHNSDASFALVRPKKDLCIGCHRETTREYPWMHGPVALGDCAACHDAHKSPYKHIVLATTKRLCLGCHEPLPEDGSTLGCVRDSDDADCVDCHNPHGGDKAFFLADRPVPEAEEPAAPPSPGEED